MRRALEDSVDRVVVADRRRDGLGTVDHDLRGVRVPEGRHQPGTLGLGPAQTLDALDVDLRHDVTSRDAIFLGHAQR